MWSGNGTAWTYARAQQHGATIVFTLPAPQAETAVQPLIYGPRRAPCADAPIPSILEYPDLSLRCVSDVTILPRHVIVKPASGEILSWSFTRNRKKHHGGLRYSAECDRHIHRLQLDPGSPLAQENVYYIDTDHPEVYGHALLEVFPSLWAAQYLEMRKLRFASSMPLNRTYRAILDVLDVHTDQFLHIRQPVVCKTLYRPDPPVLRRRHIHPVAREVFARIKRLGLRSDAPTPEKIYLSRSKLAGRRLLNEAEVEQHFAARGFAIVHPQELPIEDQIKLISNARAIAGVGGSAMHNAVFAREDARVLIVSSPGWLVVADMLICNRHGMLGYVFGQIPEGWNGQGRSQANWVVNIDDVQAAATEHFG